MRRRRSSSGCCHAPRPQTHQKNAKNESKYNKTGSSLNINDSMLDWIFRGPGSPSFSSLFHSNLGPEMGPWRQRARSLGDKKIHTARSAFVSRNRGGKPDHVRTFVPKRM